MEFMSCRGTTGTPLSYRHRIAPVIPAGLPFTETQERPNGLRNDRTERATVDYIDMLSHNTHLCVKAGSLDEIASQVSDHSSGPDPGTEGSNSPGVSDGEERRSADLINVLDNAVCTAAASQDILPSLHGRDVQAVCWSASNNMLTLTMSETQSYTVNAKQGLTLFGRAMRWCRSHPDQHLNPELSQLWVLLDLKGRSSCPSQRSYITERGKTYRGWKSSNQWEIERIVIRDGKADNSGIVLERNDCYGSDNLHGGNQSFHPIKFHTLKVRRLTKRQNLSFGKSSLDLIQPIANSDITGGPRFKFDDQSDVPVLDQIMAQCRQNVGRPVIIGGPGARSKIKNIRKYLTKEHGRVFMASQNGECMIAPILNAIYRLFGTEWANYARKRSTVCFIKGLGEASEWIKGLKVHVQLQGIQRKERKEYHKNQFKWIAGRKAGVYICRLESKTVNHCVVVDGNIGVVVDSFERFPLILSEELLLLLGGSEAGNLRVGEIREVVTQKVLGKPSFKDYVEEAITNNKEYI